MTPMELEEWLLAQAGATAHRMELEAANERSHVGELEKRREQLAAGAVADCETRAAVLTAKCAKLDESIARLEEGTNRAVEQLVAEIECGLTAFEESAAVGTLRDIQELFDRYAPDDLPDTVEAMPAAMLETVLDRSPLVRTLDAELSEEVALCLRKLAEAAAIAPTAADTAQQLEEARQAIRRALGRLEEHAVAPEVLGNLERIEQTEWLLEDVLEPYTAAACAESPWKLRRAVFKELGYGL